MIDKSDHVSSKLGEYASRVVKHSDYLRKPYLPVKAVPSQSI